MAAEDGVRFRDRGRLSKTLAGATVVFVIVGGVWVILTLARAADAVTRMSPGMMILSWAIVGLLVIVLITVALQFIRPQLRRFDALVAAFPEAYVAMMATVDGTAEALRRSAYATQTIRFDLVVVIREGRIELWKGVREPKRLVTIPASAVLEVGIGLAQMDTATAKVVGLALPSEDEGPIWLKLMPEERSRWFGIVPPTSEFVETAAENLRIRVELEGGQRLPPVSWIE